MKKFNLIFILMISSKWFIPLFILPVTYINFNLICIFNQCENKSISQTTYNNRFEIIANVNNKIISIPLKEKEKFINKYPNIEFEIENQKGKTDNNWEYEILSKNENEQIIKIHYFDSVNKVFIYKVKEKNIVPIYSKVTSSGMLFSSLIFSLLFLFSLKKLIQTKF